MDSETGEKSGESVMPIDASSCREEYNKSKEKTQVSPDNATGQVDAMEEDIEIVDEKETEFEVESLWCLLLPKTDKSGFEFPRVTNDKTILSVRGERITVSMIQNYIKEKLKLNDYTEVDILCHGKKLESEFTLKMIQFIWMSGRPGYDVRAEVKNVEDFVIELGYVRNEKLITSESSR